jgi:hypothetical protein
MIAALNFLIILGMPRRTLSSYITYNTYISTYVILQYILPK